MTRIGSWLRSYWAWTRGGSKWRLAAGIAVPLFALLIVLSAAFGDSSSQSTDDPTSSAASFVATETPTPDQTAITPTPTPAPAEGTGSADGTNAPAEPTQDPSPQPEEQPASDLAARAGSLAGDIAALSVAAEDRTGYDRDLFGDYDRPAVLADNFADWPTCDGYYSLADDQCYTQASDVDVDHIVALGEAWDSGASEWPAAQLDDFAGDFDNLWLMTDNLNQSKSDEDIAEWVPPYQESVCIYVVAYVGVKVEWELSVDQVEKAALESLSVGCGGGHAPVATMGPTQPATPVPTVTAPTIVPPTEAPSGGDCDPAYPTICISVGSPDLNCGDIPQYSSFEVLPPDPHGFDGNNDNGLGCENN